MKKEKNLSGDGASNRKNPESIINLSESLALILEVKQCVA